MIVTEKIAVTAASKQIKHGIFRQIPLIRRDGRDARIRQVMDVLSAILIGWTGG
ncbi:MAG: hypothetical protein WAT09_13595 [Paracoccaceae bacterium]